jgi:membrane protein
MSKPGADRMDGLRSLAARVIDRVGGLPATTRLVAVLDSFDRAGGGLVAGGLAYAALVAILPMILLVLSIVGLIVTSPAMQEEIVAAIGRVLPPLEDVARAAFEQVSAGAVPTSIIAFIGLLWGSSRFYSAIDTAFSRIYSDSPRRDPIRQSIRGLLVTGILVLMPVALITVGSILSWFADVSPGEGEFQDLVTSLREVASPLVTLVVFTTGTALCYRYVPSRHVPWRALLLPAALVGLVLAVFTQLFTIIAPRLVGAAALYGAFVALFGLLAWLSIGFNVLMFGAAWAEVRSRLGPLWKAPDAGAGASRPSGS